jgi:hypothetical protein
MTDCECLPRCPFFQDQMKGMPSMAEHVKSRYCRGGWAECARYQVFKALGPGRVPSDLFPIQLERVEEIVARARPEE